MPLSTDEMAARVAKAGAAALDADVEAERWGLDRRRLEVLRSALPVYERALREAASAGESALRPDQPHTPEEVSELAKALGVL